MGAYHDENGIALVARVDDVDMNLAAPTTTILYTVPTGYQFIPDRVVIKPAASGFTTLAAATDLDLGKTGTPTDFANAFNPSGLINADLVLSIGADALELPPIYDAAEVVQLVNNVAATAGSLVDVFVFGTLVVA